MAKGMRLAALAFVLLTLTAADVVSLATAQLSGNLVIAGSTTVLPINQECARILMERNPDLRISVSGGGSGLGIMRVAAGDIDIGAASRDLKDEEKKKYPDLNLFVIAKDSVAIVINPENPVSDLTLEQISKIFAGEIKNWKEVGGHDAEIRVITREEGSGTRETFEKYVLKPYNRSISERAFVKSSNGEVKATVATDKNAIGYISLGYVDESVKALKIDGKEATVENVLSDEYPITRDLYLITKGEPDPLEKAFIDFVLSGDGQKIVQELGYIPVNPSATTTPTPTSTPITPVSTATPASTPTPGASAVIAALSLFVVAVLLRRRM